jgi:hypothetical protein
MTPRALTPTPPQHAAQGAHRRAPLQARRAKQGRRAKHALQLSMLSPSSPPPSAYGRRTPCACRAGQPQGPGAGKQIAAHAACCVCCCALPAGGADACAAHACLAERRHVVARLVQCRRLTVWLRRAEPLGLTAPAPASSELCLGSSACDASRVSPPMPASRMVRPHNQQTPASGRRPAALPPLAASFPARREMAGRFAACGAHRLCSTGRCGRRSASGAVSSACDGSSPQRCHRDIRPRHRTAEPWTRSDVCKPDKHGADDVQPPPQRQQGAAQPASQRALTRTPLDAALDAAEHPARKACAPPSGALRVGAHARRNARTRMCG